MPPIDLPSHEFLRVEVLETIAVVQLHRPEVLNALNSELMTALVEVLEALDQDERIGCVVITGNEKAFAAGADIKTMATASAVEMLQSDPLACWDGVRKIKKPLIAAVQGYALGGGCELALMCDMIIASETAKFGQPEINLGVIPGAGGTQRLTHAVGKAKAMELLLTGRNFTAQEALALGLINQIVPAAECLEAAKALARQIAAKGPLAVQLTKAAVLKAFDTSLTDGLEYERKLFYFLFASEDQKEGMRAFLEKRPPVFRGQ